MGKLKRPSFMLFIDTTGGSDKPEYHLAGVYSDDLSISYNPTTEESQDVTDVASTTDVTGYAQNVPVSTKVVAKKGQKGYVLSNYINTLRKNLATADDATTNVLYVDAYGENGAIDFDEGSDTLTATAQKFSASIQIDTYGGAAGETLGIDYTVNINGSPTNGTAKVTKDSVGDKTAVFTEGSSEE